MPGTGSWSGSLFFNWFLTHPVSSFPSILLYIAHQKSAQSIALKTNDTETQILEAAKQVFIRKGFAGARMQEIADAAQINKSMLHYYFRSKEKLFERIMQEAIALMQPRMKEALSGEAPVLQKLEQMVHSYIDTISQNPHIPLFVLHELSQNRQDFASRMREAMQEDQTMQRFMAQVVAEQQAGKLKPMQPLHLMLSVMSLIMFPFIAKPAFTQVFSVPEALYQQMMQERKEVVMQFLRATLQGD